MVSYQISEGQLVVLVSVVSVVFFCFGFILGALSGQKHIMKNYKVGQKDD